MYILGDLVNNCNLELEMAAEWFQANRLTLNAKKTKCMVFGPNGNSVPLPKNLNIAGETIERIGDRFPTKHFKFVGVLLDDNINWNEQFKLVKNNIAKVSYNLARAKRCIPEHIELLIYNSLIRYHLEYWLPIWGDLSSANKKTLLSIQNNAVRNIRGSKYNSHTDPIFRKQKIMKFCDLYNFNCASLMFKISMGIHPPSITNMFIKCDNFDRNLNYSLDMLPYTYLKKLVPHSLIKIWNSTNIAHKNYLKEKPAGISKLINAPTEKNSWRALQIP